jgi:hypothetical protein
MKIEQYARLVPKEIGTGIGYYLTLTATVLFAWIISYGNWKHI